MMKKFTKLLSLLLAVLMAASLATAAFAVRCQSSN